MALAGNEEERQIDSPSDFLKVMNEEPVQLVLASMDSGIGLIGVEFQPDLKSEECLLSGFLTALRFVSNGIFLLPLNEMRFGKYTMLVRTEPPFLYCYTFSGGTGHSSHRLDRFISVLQEEATLLDSLRNTISTGEVDKQAKSAIGNLANEVFALSSEQYGGCE
jgi:hypothetical protein